MHDLNRQRATLLNDGHILGKLGGGHVLVEQLLRLPSLNNGKNITTGSALEHVIPTAALMRLRLGSEGNGSQQMRKW